MKVLLLGGQGMAGHMIASYWYKETGHRLTATIRPGSSGGNRLPEEDDRFTMRELDVRDLRMVENVVWESNPDLIINTVGLLNRDAESRPLDSHLVNGLLPHWLAYLADRQGSRLLHVSTDCVFTGDRGQYRENETPDGDSIYARTKALGEVQRPRHATIRTSIIGPDAKAHGIGLFQWFLSRQGDVTGYQNVPWNGVTTLELAKATVWLSEHPEADGLIHLAAAEAITKYDLLRLMQNIFNKRDVTVAAQAEPRIDRTLAVTRPDMIYTVPSYERMLYDLRDWMNSP